jgi:16S rRNA (adenine1518-N6/adenine1519-N6)-dimethyltransferase
MAPFRRPPRGQVFLTDRRVIGRIMSALALGPDDAVLEIGPGPGTMTELLAERAAKLWAVEVDAKLVAGLRERFVGFENVEVIEADILTVKIDSLCAAAGRDRIRVFGNLPYYITSPILLRLFEFHTRIADIVVMVQREVAERMVAKPGSKDYGLLSVTCQYYTEPRMLFSIPPQAFRPAPKVHSALVEMRVAPMREKLGIEDETSFWRLVQAAFGQRRKTLANNWKGRCEAERLREAMADLGIDPRTRAETLGLEEFAGLVKAVSQD